MPKDLNDKRGHLSSVCQLYNGLIMTVSWMLGGRMERQRERERQACAKRKHHLNETNHF